MKKILFLLISITIIFSSCEKEEENSSNNNSNNNNNNVYVNINPDSIIGLWRHDYILQNSQLIILDPNTNVEVIIGESLNNLEVPLGYNDYDDNTNPLFGDLMFWFDENVHRLTDFIDTVYGGEIQIEDLPYSINGSEIRMVEEDSDGDIDIVYRVIKNTYGELDFDFEILYTNYYNTDTIYIERCYGTVHTNRE